MKYLLPLLLLGCSSTSKTISYYDAFGNGCHASRMVTMTEFGLLADPKAANAWCVDLYIELYKINL